MKSRTLSIPAFLDRHLWVAMLLVVLTGVQAIWAIWAIGAIGATGATGAVQDNELSLRRAGQRKAVREASLRAEKSGGGAPFGLLVIPVDFRDTRLPAGWSASSALAPRLSGEQGESLRNYFHATSGGRSDLRITLAPTVHLAGDRRDYVDPPTAQSFWASREMARLALESVRDSGLPLRLLDMDGPDGLPGTADDDGQVDGVLILHAGPGLENDGLIPPLQYYLDEPVAADGVSASCYAVAAMGSGLGIWAHETAHLFGLEERYDPTLPAAGESELHSRGGLGRFSLMSAGAWGTGGGQAPALLDAYSRWQLGWCDLVDLPRIPADADTLQALAAGGRAARVWTHGQPDHEFFLLEVRDPAAAAPFDAAVPGGSLVVYHVDETVPDGGYIATGPGQRRLRAHLLEADGNSGLRDGDDEGSAADLFPGSLGVTSLTPWTTPSSDGISGPSHVALTGITSIDGRVAFEVSAADSPAVRHTLAFLSDGAVTLDLDVRSLGTPLVSPTATLQAGVPTLGTFSDGSTEVAFGLVETSPGRWAPDRTITWWSDAGLPAGAATRFILRITDGTWDSGQRTVTWQWDDNGSAFDFGFDWPGQWSVATPGDPDTRWHRWVGSGGPTNDGSTVLACTGAIYSAASDWPDMRYWPRAHATLTSPAAGPGVTALRIVHAWDTETLPTGEGMDGGTLEWVTDDGRSRPAEPVDGWPAALSGQSDIPLLDRGGFAGDMELRRSKPVWQVDVVAVPTDEPGPWRLRFSFASNGLYSSQRGWLIAEVQPLATEVPTTALPVSWDATGLRWSDPSGIWADEGRPENLDATGWQDLLAPGVVPVRDGDGYWLAVGDVLPYLSGTRRTRHEVRLIGISSLGALASRTIVIYPDGGEAAAPFLGLPWPNPSHDVVRFLLEVNSGDQARLRICDLGGRVLRESSHPAGSHLLDWDGSDSHGRRVASGMYILHVEGNGGSRSHKVVLLR